MDRDEVLDKSRKENKFKDVAGDEVEKQASYIALSIGVVICFAITALEWFLKGTRNNACWALIFGMLSTVYLVKYLKLRRRSNLAAAILCVILFLFFGYCYLATLFGTR